MADPIVQFVDSISTTANLRYDFSYEGSTLRCFPLGADAIDFGAPSFTGEPEGVGGYYGYRTIRFTQRIIATRAVALARMSLLAKEIFRATNYLKFQWDPTAPPVFFKTYRAEPGTLSLENAGQADAWDIVVSLVADPFAYGARQTMSTFQVVQGPVDLTGPTRTAMHVVLPAIKGDAPTGLRVTVTPAAGASAGSSGQTWMVGCISGETTMTDPVINIGASDGFTAGSGTSASVADATFFNGDYRTVTISAGAGNHLSRLTGPLGSVPAGRYKVLIRCELTSVARYTFQLGRVFATGNIYGPTVTSRTFGSVFRGWIDLGEHTFPYGTQTPLDVTAAAPVPSIDLKIGTADALAGTAKIDAFKLIPVDGRTVTKATLQRAVFDNKVLLVTGVAGTFDADTESYWSTTSGVLNETVPTLSGQAPIADPAASKNLLVVMSLYDDNGASASVTSTNFQAAVDVSYYPRYLYIGDGP